MDLPGIYWVRAEYLYWRTSGTNVPALLTTSPLGTDRTQAGVLGQPGTSVVFGDQSLNESWRSGLRITPGIWLDEEHAFGLQASFFWLNSSSSGVSIPNAGAMILTRPFFNAQTNAPDTELISLPGTSTGSAGIAAPSGVLGVDCNLRCRLCCSSCPVCPPGGCSDWNFTCTDSPSYQIDLLCGYRYLQLDDRLTVNETVVSTSLTSPVPLGTNFLVQDGFHTTNQFQGGQLGLRGEMQQGPWLLEGTGTVALGNVQTVADIGGSTQITVPGFPPTIVQPGGLLTQQTNSGRYTVNHFAVLPTVDLHVGYQLTSGLRAWVGYNFLYLSAVTRTGNVIDSELNLSQLPPGTLVGPARPTFLAGHSDYWLQGPSAGLEFRY